MTQCLQINDQQNNNQAEKQQKIKNIDRIVRTRRLIVLIELFGLQTNFYCVVILLNYGWLRGSLEDEKEKEDDEVKRRER